MSSIGESSSQCKPGFCGADGAEVGWDGALSTVAEFTDDAAGALVAVLPCSFMVVVVVAVVVVDAAGLDDQ